MPRLWTLFLAALITMLVELPLAAKEALPAAADPALEARVQAVAAELRCLVCQNQTIADSTSDLANDLRREVREQLQRGVSDEQVVQYMTDRYGDFVRYRPPFKANTALLWLGPAALLVVGLAALAMVLRRRAKLGPEAFEADEDASPDDPPALSSFDRASAERRL